MTRKSPNRVLAFIADYAHFIVLAFISIYFVYFVASALSWRMDQNSPIVMYLAYLFGKSGYIPYRDVFDINLPGTYIIYAIIGKLSGYTDYGFRIAELVILAVITIATYFALRPLSRAAAWAGPALFGILYFGNGPGFSLEREILLLIFISLALLTTLSVTALNRYVKAGLIGLFFGCAALIKPAALIAFPILIIFLMQDGKKPNRSDIKKYVIGTVVALLGLILPFAAAIIYLWQTGALPYFRDIAVNYWPLYADFIGLGNIKYYILHTRSLTNFEIWVIIAAINAGCALLFFKPDNRQRNIIILLIALAVSFYLYPALSGQFYGYHWLPFLYFLCLLGSLAFLKPPKELHISLRYLPVIVLLLACIISFKLPGGAFRNIYGEYDVVAPRGGIPDEIAEYLVEHLEPGDKVQPLDWAWGGIHGVLLARGELATSFIYDFHFYHHVNDDYIEGLRNRFVAELEEVRPRFIVEIPYEAHPRNNSLGPEQEFPELRAFIEDNYVIMDMKEGDGYIIYERVM